MKLMVNIFDGSVDRSIVNKLGEILQSGQLNSGPYVDELETLISEIYGAAQCFAFSDMTTAIIQLLRYLRVGKNDVIACHPYCCLSTTMAINVIGAKVRWIDLCPKSLSLNISSLSDEIKGAKVLLNYNVAGYLPNLSKIEEICKLNDVLLINDCNNSHLSKFCDKFAVSYGDYSILSFYPNRNFGGIDCGIIISKNPLDGNFREYTRLGLDRQNYKNDKGVFYENHDVNIATGANNCTNLSAYIILNKLERFNQCLIEGQTLFDEYMSHLELQSFIPTINSQPVPWVYPIKVRDVNVSMNLLRSIGVDVALLHYPNNKYSVFDADNKLTSWIDDLNRKVIWIPFHKDMSNLLIKVKLPKIIPRE